jgi:hypothetical protein
MTASLRKHNFTLGDESKGFNKDMYETDYNSGYGSVPASAYSQRHLDRDEIKKTIEDSRSSHYSLGNGQHKVHYESIAHSSMNTINQDDGGISSALRYRSLPLPCIHRYMFICNLYVYMWVFGYKCRYI